MSEFVYNRIVLTADSSGKLIEAKLQEADTFMWDGGPDTHWLWRDVKPLKVTPQPDGKVSIENPWKDKI